MATNRDDERLARGAETAPVSRRDRARRVGLVALGAVGALFAVLNLDEVEVQLLFGSPQLPLVVVIVACIAIGVGIGMLLARRQAGRRAGR